MALRLLHSVGGRPSSGRRQCGPFQPRLSTGRSQRKVSRWGEIWPIPMRVSWTVPTPAGHEYMGHRDFPGKVILIAACLKGIWIVRRTHSDSPLSPFRNTFEGINKTAFAAGIALNQCSSKCPAFYLRVDMRKDVVQKRSQHRRLSYPCLGTRTATEIWSLVSGSSRNKENAGQETG